MKIINNPLSRSLSIFFVLLMTLVVAWPSGIVAGMQVSQVKAIDFVDEQALQTLEGGTIEAWLGSGWANRLPVNISNPCGIEQTDFQVNILLDGSFNFAHALADGSDLRVTSADGSTIIPFWIESWNPPTSASIWIKLPTLPLAGATVYLYYGNQTPPAIPQVEVGPTGPWTKPAGNPINPIGDPGAGASLLAENMVYDSVTGHYWLTFSNYRTSPSSIGLAWSDDPGNPGAWNWYNGSVVTSAISPHILYHNGLWYIFYSDRAVASPYPIVVVSSSSITGPYTNKQTILTAGVAGSWEDFRVDEPYVLQRSDGTWVLTYMGDAGGAVEQIGIATASDLLGPYTKAAGNPVIAFGAGYYDAGTVADPWVVNFNNTYYIGYTVSPTTSSPWQTAYATTTDWVTFTKRGMTLPLGVPGSWDATNAFRGAVTRFGDTYYFPYTGYVGSYRMGIATQPAYKAINDPDLVFEIYDGFDGTTLSTKWNYLFTGSGHTISVSGGQLTLTAVPGTSSGLIQLWASPLLGSGTIVEAYGRHPDAGLNPGSTETNTAAEVGYKITTIFNDVLRILDYPDLVKWTLQGARAGTSSGYIDSAYNFDTNWHIFRVARLPDGSGRFQLDNNPSESMVSTYVPVVPLQPWLASYSRLPAPQSRFIVDWARARKYCGTEPTVTLGAEEYVDLAVTLGDTPDPVIAGYNLTYTAQVTNNGTITATAVTLSVTLPPELGLISATPSQGTCTGTTCNLGDLALSGGTATVTLVTAVDPGALGQIISAATASSDFADAQPSDNTIQATTTVNASADLSVTKSGSAEPVIAGNQLTYTLSVLNSGPSDAANVNAVDTLPTQATFVSASAGCSHSAGIVTCSLGDVDAGAAVQSQILVLVNPGASGALSNQVNVSSDTSDPDPLDNQSTLNTTIIRQADLQITKTDNPDPVTAGQTLTYTLAIVNNGPSSATSVTVTDTLPAGVTLVSATPSQGTCTGTTCSLGTLAPGPATVTLVVMIDSGTLGDVLNTAGVSALETDPNPSNNTDAETTSVVPGADLSLVKSDIPDPVIAGQQLTYNLTVGNTGPSDVLNTVVVDTLPGQVTFVSASAGCTHASVVVTCNVGSLTVGETRPLSIVVQVSGFASGTLVNNAQVSSEAVDPDPSDNQASASTTVQRDVDLVLTKTDNPDPVLAGQGLVYTLSIENQGISDATGVTAVDTLPGQVTFVSASAGCTHSAGVVTCSLGNLLSGASATVTINVTVSPGASGQISNQATVTSGDPDAAPSDNTDTEPTTVNTSADVSVTKVDTPDPVIAGQQLTYNLTVVNGGPSNAQNVTTVDTLPGQVMFVSASAGCTHSAGVVTCSLGTMGPGSSLQRSIVVQVSGFASGTLVNNVTVSSSTSDPDPSDNQASASTTVQRDVDLVLTKTDNPDPVLAGQGLVYTLSIENQGISDATAVTAVDTLPGQVTFVSASAGCTHSAGVVTCSLGNLLSGASATVTINVTVSPGASGQISNQATVTSGDPDAAPSDNTDTEPTTVNTSADVSVTKVDTPDPVIAGQQLTYNLTVVNGGPSNAQNVTAVDTLPGQVMFVSASAGCTHAAGVVTCSLGTMGPGSSLQRSIVVQVSGFASGTLVNNVTVSSSTSDPDPSDNQASASTTVQRDVDLVLTKTDNPDPVLAGQGLVYTLSIENQGISDATGVTAVDTLPGQVTFVSASAGCTHSAGVVTCSLGNLLSGASATVTINVTVSPGASGQISNQATVTSGDPDAAPSDNTDTEPTTVNTSADVSVTKVDTPDPVIAGQQLTYNLTVVNGGPSNAQNVTAVDTLPDDVEFVSASAGCTHSAGVVTCSLGILSPGQNVPLTILVLVSPGASGTLVNNVTVNSSTGDPDPSDNQASASTTVLQQADLLISKLDEPDPATAGYPLTYTLVVENLGPSNASAVQVVDSLPAEVTLISADPSQGNCNGTICDLGALNAGTAATVTLVVQVDPGMLGEILNTASVSSGTTDPNPANNSDQESTHIDAGADLSLAKIDDPDPVTAGEYLTYTLTVVNSGPSDAQDVSVIDVLPGQVTFISGTPGCSEAGGFVTCALGTVAAGGQDQAQILVIVSPGAAGTIVNEAEVTSGTSDPDPGDNDAMAETAVDLEADVQVRKFDDPDPAIAGDLLTYTVLVANAGPSDAYAVQVIDSLPEEVTLVSAEPSQGTCAQASCDLGALAASGTATVTLVVQVDPGILGVLTNTVGLTTTTPDPTPGDHAAQTETTIVAFADLALNKGAEPDSVIAGDLLTYTLVITNHGPSDAVDSIIFDTLPDQVTFVSASPGCSEASGLVTCTLGTVVAGEARLIEIIVFVSSSANGIIENQAQVFSETSDPNLENNQAVRITTIITQADLSLGILDNPDPVLPGSLLTYTLVITNNGPSDANQTLLTDTLPAQVDWVSTTPSQGDCALFDSQVLCILDGIPAAGQVQVTIVVLVNSVAQGSLTNQAEVQSAVDDPQPDNNLSVEITSIQPSDEEPPTLIWIAPVGDGQFYQVYGQVVRLEVDAQDNIGIERVYFYRWDPVNEQFIAIGTVFSAPYIWDFDTSVLVPGWNEILAKAYDLAGNETPGNQSYIWLIRLVQIYLPIVGRD